MISITFFKDSAGITRAFTSKGHSGYAEAGSDIVCSAISALTINTVNSIENFTEDRFEAEADDGYMTFSFSDKNISKESQLLMNSLELGVSGIVNDYSKYVQIIIKEV